MCNGYLEYLGKILIIKLMDEFTSLIDVLVLCGMLRSSSAPSETR